MRRFPPTLRCLFSILLVQAFSVVAGAEAVDAAAVEAVLQDALKTWQVPGASIAVVRADAVIYLKGFGVKEQGSQGAVTPDTVFPLASCTKAFTTTAMAMLVDEGKMDWDDPVRKHVEFFRLADPLSDANVTLRDLVTHRTGLSGHDLLWYRSKWGQEEIIRRIGRVKLTHPFRSGFQYQSIMFTTAGHAVSAASKSSWKDFVQKRIFDPLGMAQASFTTNAATQAADHASPHRRNQQGKIEVIPWYAIDVPDPAGSINASARDLAQWVRFHLGDGTYRGKRLVSARNLAETHTPQIVIRLEGTTKAMNPDTTQMSYGMGWVIQDYRGQLLVSHAGFIDGFRVHITLVPHKKLGIVLLNNLHGTRMNLAVSNRLVDLLLGLPSKDWNAYLGELAEREAAADRARAEERQRQRRHGTQPTRELAAYTGTYEEPAYGTARIMLKDGSLVWEWSTFHCPLEHYHFDTFTVASDLLGNPQVVFTLDADGAVAKMNVLDVDFRKKGK